MVAHFCKLHGTPFFKRGTMRGFAHPILDDSGEKTGEWCNEPKSQETEQAPRRVVAPDRERSIERQVALKSAIELAVVDKITVEKILETAQKFSMWLNGEFVPQVTTELGIVVVDTPRSLVEEAKKLGAVEIEEPHEITWADVQPGVKALFDAKVAGWATVDSIIKRLISMGADKSSKDTKTAFNRLNNKSKQEFKNLVEKEGR